MLLTLQKNNLFIIRMLHVPYVYVFVQTLLWDQVMLSSPPETPSSTFPNKCKFKTYCTYPAFVVITLVHSISSPYVHLCQLVLLYLTHPLLGASHLYLSLSLHRHRTRKTIQRGTVKSKCVCSLYCMIMLKVANNY